jgi:uncharacterized protein HemX
MAPIMSESIVPSAPAPGAPYPVDPAAPQRLSGPAVTEPGTGRGAPAPRLGWLAVLLAAVAVLLGWLALQRAGDVQQRLDQERADNQVRDQRAAERERRLDELQRQWTQAQSEADVAAVQMPEANLRRRRDLLALIDIERVVEQVQLQLRLGAPPSLAVDALTAADARLGRLSGPGPGRVQAALHRDLLRLKALPDLDRGLLASRLDALFSAVDAWHASADPTHPSERPAPLPTTTPATTAAAATSTVPAPGAAHAATSAATLGQRVRAWISSEFGDMLRIREIDTPEALQLGPAQQQLLRDRVRLGILDLREAILTRDERTIRADETALEALLTRYFDVNQAEVAAAIAQLHATASSVMAGAAPSLDETLAALRAARSSTGG